jgi:copper oxidase (laccase) domain-containing protein
MLDRTIENIHDEAIVANRKRFCQAVGIDYRECAYQQIRYNDDSTYDVIREVDQPDSIGVAADVLYTKVSGVGLFLPIADCIGTILYDPVRKALALAHLGRHASVAGAMKKTIEFFIEKGSSPADIIIWMSPGVAQKNYRMAYFDKLNDPDWQSYAERRNDGVYLDLVGFNRTSAQQAGVLAENIHSSAVDTATDQNYFSHSRGDVAARFAVVVMMR